MWKEGVKIKIKIKINFSLVHALKAHEAGEVQLQSFLTLRLNYVSGQIYVPILRLDEAGVDYLQRRKTLAHDGKLIRVFFSTESTN
jgi:hypothetical protein